MAKVNPTTWSPIIPGDVHHRTPLTNDKPASMKEASDQMARCWTYHVRELATLRAPANLGQGLTGVYQVIGEGVVSILDKAWQPQVILRIFARDIEVLLNIGGVNVGPLVAVAPGWYTSAVTSIALATIPANGLAVVQILAKTAGATPRFICASLIEVAQTTVAGIPDGSSSKINFVGLDQDCMVPDEVFDAFLTQQLSRNVRAIQDERSRGSSILYPSITDSFAGAQHLIGSVIWRGDGPYMLRAEPWTNRARVAITVDTRGPTTESVFLFAMSSAERFRTLVSDGSRIEEHKSTDSITTYVWDIEVTPGEMNYIWIMHKSDALVSIDPWEIAVGHFGHVRGTLPGTTSLPSGFYGNYPLTWGLAIADRRITPGVIDVDAGAAGDGPVAYTGTLRDIVSVPANGDSGGDTFSEFWVDESSAVVPDDFVNIGGDQSAARQAALLTVGFLHVACVMIEGLSSGDFARFQLAEDFPRSVGMKREVIQATNGIQAGQTFQAAFSYPDQQDTKTRTATLVGSGITQTDRSYGDWTVVNYDSGSLPSDETVLTVPIVIDPNAGAVTGLLSHYIRASILLAGSHSLRGSSASAFILVRVRLYHLGLLTVADEVNIEVEAYQVGSGRTPTNESIGVYHMSSNNQRNDPVINSRLLTGNAYTQTKCHWKDVERPDEIWTRSSNLETLTTGVTFPTFAVIGVKNLGLVDDAGGIAGADSYHSNPVISVGGLAVWASERSL